MHASMTMALTIGQVATAALVYQKIRDLQRMKRSLERLTAACAARLPTDACPILEALEDHGVARR